MPVISPDLTRNSYPDQTSRTHLSLINPRLSLFVHAFKGVTGIIGQISRISQPTMKETSLNPEYLEQVKTAYEQTCAKSYADLNRYTENRPLSFQPLIEVVGYDAHAHTVKALRFLSPEDTDKFAKAFEIHGYQELQPIVPQKQLEAKVKASIRKEFKDEIGFQSRNECFGKTEHAAIKLFKKDLPTILS